MYGNFRVFDKMMVGVQVIDNNWQYCYLNDVAIKHSKRKREELIGHTPHELYPEIEKTELFSALKTAMESKVSKTFVNKFDYPDGSFSYFNLYIEPIDEGLLIQSFDITKQKNDEENLLKINKLLDSQYNLAVEKSDILNNLLTEKNATIKKILEEKEFADSLFQYSTSGILLTNKEGEIIRVNPNAEKMFGYEKGELFMKNIEVLMPQRVADVHQIHRKKFNLDPHPRAMGSGMSLLAKRKDDSEFPVEISLSPFTKNDESYTIVFIIDISIRKKNEDDIRKRKMELQEKNSQLEKQAVILSKSLEEKTALVKEIHHRVKNNLQLIISLIHLQSNQFMNDFTKSVLQSFESKIGTMALVHHLLYSKGSLTTLNIEDFVNMFSSYVLNDHKTENIDLDIDINLNHKTVNVDTAIAFGLLLNEIFTNAIKHGCTKENECKILLYLKDDDQRNFALKIGDNGNGIPKEVLEGDKFFLGLSLIDDLVSQLEGKYERNSNGNGTFYDISFKEINTNHCTFPNNDSGSSI